MRAPARRAGSSRRSASSWCTNGKFSMGRAATSICCQLHWLCLVWLADLSWTGAAEHLQVAVAADQVHYRDVEVEQFHDRCHDMIRRSVSP